MNSSDSEPDSPDSQGCEEEEMEKLLVGMYRDLPPDLQLMVFDVVTEAYCLSKKSSS